MSLSKKTFFILAIVSILSFLVFYISFHTILTNNYGAIEEERVVTDVNRILNTLQSEADSLDLLVKDWSRFDDTYDFINGNNSSYIKKNLPDGALEHLNLYCIGFFDQQGELLYGKAFDEKRNLTIPFPEGLKKHLHPDGLIINNCREDVRVNGLLQIPEGLIILSAYPAKTSDGNSPPLGTVIMARKINGRVEKKIKEISQIPLSFKPYVPISDDYAEIEFDLIDGRKISGNISSTDTLTINVPVYDLYGQAAASLELFFPNVIPAYKQYAVNYFTIAMVGLAILLISLIMLLFSRLVIRRITLLSNKVNWIGKYRDPSVRIPVTGNDEISLLSSNINEMLSELEYAQQQLAQSKQQYQMLFDEALSANYICTPEGKLVLCNPTFLKMLGYHYVDELIHTNAWDLLTDLRNKEQFLLRLQQNRKIENWERIIRTASGKKITVLENIVGIFDANDELIQIQGYMFDITERKQAEEAIHYLSFHDKLTGLHNRTYFEEKLHQFDNPASLPLSIIVIDVNGLKIVNDALGHLKGDELLIKIAHAIKNSCRQYDIVCRWGGDEYMVLLPSTSLDIAEHIVERIVSACSRIEIQGIGVSASAGAMSKESPDEKINDILKQAESKMYRAKLLQDASNRNTTIKLLQRSLYQKGHETKEHVNNLKDLLLNMARHMAMRQSERDELVLLANLHDIGKIAIPDYILNKPLPLSEDEVQIVQKHCEIGYQIAKSSPEMASVAEAILCHHEHWDGQGYPLGLKGKGIPLYARMLAVADAFEVMTHDRPYKKKLSYYEALDELKRGAGTHFDPKLVDIFIHLQKKTE